MIEERHDYGYTINGDFRLSKELIEKYGLRHEEGSDAIVIQRFGFTIATFNDLDQPELNLAQAIAWCQEHYKDIPSVPPGVVRGYLPALKQRGFNFWFDPNNCVWVLSRDNHIYNITSHEETREAISEIMKYSSINILTAHQTGEQQPMMSGEVFNQKFFAIIKVSHNQTILTRFETYEDLHQAFNSDMKTGLNESPVLRAITEDDLNLHPELIDIETWNIGSFMILQGNIREPIKRTEVMLKWR